MKKNTATPRLALLFLAFALTAAGFGLLQASTAHAEGNALERIVDSGVIRIGIYDNAPPLNYVDQRGRRQGFETELIKRLATDLLGPGARIELVPLLPDERITALEDDAVDILVCDLSVTPDRQVAVAFSRPYLKMQTGVLSSNNNPVTGVEQLYGRGLIVVRGTTAQLFFQVNHPEVRLLEYDNDAEAFAALQRGAADAMAHDNLLLFAWSLANPGFSAAIPALGDVDMIAPAVRADQPQLREWLDNEMDRLVEGGFFQEAYNSHLRAVYGAALTPDMVVPLPEGVK